MTAPAHQYPGNQRWRTHADPHMGCWCVEERQALRAELVRLIAADVPWPADVAAADRLLTADTLRIELR